MRIGVRRCLVAMAIIIGVHAGPARVALAADPGPLVIVPAEVRAKRSDADEMALLRQWGERLIVEPYIKYGDHGGKPDPDAIAFLRTAAPLFDLGFNSARPPELVPMAEALLAKNVTDPCVLRVIGVVLTEMTAAQVKGSRAIVAASESPAREKYPLWERVAIAGALAHVVRQNGAEFESWSATYNEAAKLLVEQWNAWDFDPELARRQYRTLRWPSWTKLKTDGLPPAIETIERSSPKHPAARWMRAMLLATYHNERGWEIRGGGWSKDVPPQAWPFFRKHMELAERYAMNAYELVPEWPESATLLITIANGRDSDAKHPPRHWFDRATEAEFRYRPASVALVPALRPRWGGSHKEMLEFAYECAATDRFDTRVPIAIVEVLRLIAVDIRQDNPGTPEHLVWKETFSDPKAFETANRVLQKYLEIDVQEFRTAKDSVDRSLAAWRVALNRARLVGLAAAAGREDAAYEAVVGYEDLELNADELGRFGSALLSPGQVIVMGGPERAKAQAAFKARERGDMAEFKRLLTEAGKAPLPKGPRQSVLESFRRNWLGAWLEDGGPDAHDVTKPIRRKR